MYECFHCLQKAVIWDNDYDYSDYGLEGEGIVHICHCTSCGAEIEYYVPNRIGKVPNIQNIYNMDTQFKEEGADNV